MTGSDQRKKHPRPVEIFLVVILLGSVGAFCVVRFSQALDQWQFLDLVLPLSPLYLVLSGAFWGILSLSVAVMVWVGWKRSSQMVFWFFGLGSCYYWFERLILQRYPGSHTNWLFALSLNVVLLAWIYWLVNRPQYREFTK